MSVGLEIIDKEQFSSVVMAILMSVIIGPILLAYAIKMSNDDKKSMVRDIQQELDDFEVSETERLFRYWKISLKTSARWGLMWHAQRRLQAITLDILDHRLDYSGKYDETITITFIARDDHVDLNHDGIIEKLEYDARRMKISKTAYEVCGDENTLVSVTDWAPRRIRREGCKREAHTSNQVFFLHPRFPKKDIITHNSSAEALCQRFANHIPCLAVIRDDETVGGFITKSNLVRGLLHHKMSLTHAKISDFMTDINHMIFMSKNSSPRDILETMRENNCKHMPLIDDYTGNIITIADIRDLVLSTTGESNAGAGKTERYARRDVGRDSVYWLSRAGTKIKETSRLEQECDEHMAHPFHDGHHVNKIDLIE